MLTIDEFSPAEPNLCTYFKCTRVVAVFFYLLSVCQMSYDTHSVVKLVKQQANAKSEKLKLIAVNQAGNQPTNA